MTSPVSARIGSVLAVLARRRFGAGAGGVAAVGEGLGAVSRHRRHRHRRSRAVPGRRADGQGPRRVPVHVRHHDGRQHVRQRSGTKDYAEEVRAAVQAAARREGRVLRVAGQSRRPEPAALQAVQHERRALLHVQEGQRAVLRARQQLLRPAQADWLEKALAESKEDWKICFFHHPLYSSGGRHGSEVDLRSQLEPLFLKYGVQVVFAGHEHFYERLKPQKGIHYFVNGGGAKLRGGDITKTSDDRRGLRHRSVVHAGRDRRRCPHVPDALTRRQARGQRLHPPVQSPQSRRPRLPATKN